MKHQEAMVLAYSAQTNGSFAQVPGLIELAKELARDPTALSSLKMSESAASYKSTFGLGLTFKNSLVESLRASPFSLNIDEATACNHEKVNILLISVANYLY